MTTKSCIQGPFRPHRRPRGRVLAQEAYVAMAAVACLSYVLYMVIVG